MLRLWLYRKIFNTHGFILLPIPGIVYFINTLYIQLSMRGRGMPTNLYIRDFFYKTVTEPKLTKLSNQMDFLEKFSNFA